MAGRPTLFVIPTSNAALAARLMLQAKGIEYRHVELPPMLHRPIVRALGFPGHRVPALMADGERVQGSRAIARALDRLWPEPPLFPSDPAARRAVEEAERLGEGELQRIVRWVQPWAFVNRPEAIPTFADRFRLPLPPAAQAQIALPVARLAARRNPSNEQTVRAALDLLPTLVDRIDTWIADGVLGGTQVNAADIQVTSSLRILMNYDDLGPWLATRPAGQLAARIAPEVPGRVPPVLPADALAALRAR